MMADAHIYGPDSIMLDLEDSVTMAEKDAARLLVYTSLLLANGHVHYHQEGKLAAQMPLSLMETCKASVTVLSIIKGIYS